MYVLVPEVDIHGVASLYILCVFYMVLDSDFYDVLYVFCVLFSKMELWATNALQHNLCNLVKIYWPNTSFMK